jgi:O-6-methylguanine DNA methyltransferase
MKKSREENRDPIYYGVMSSPVGKVCVAVDGKRVLSLMFGSYKESDFRNDLSSLKARPVTRADELTASVIRELQEYFDGKRNTFSFSPDLSGCTKFQRSVLKATARIPYGETRSYGWLAKRVGSPHAARAVGQTMARNPVPIIVPCHRVVGASGGLVGFGGGSRRLDLKRTLLEIEGTTGY